MANLTSVQIVPNLYGVAFSRFATDAKFHGMDGTFNTDNKAYFTDGVHLTAAGNDRLADYMAACLRTL